MDLMQKWNQWPLYEAICTSKWTNTGSRNPTLYRRVEGIPLQTDVGGQLLIDLLRRAARLRGNQCRTHKHSGWRVRTGAHHPEDTLLNTPWATPTTGAGGYTLEGANGSPCEKPGVGEGDTPFSQTAVLTRSLPFRPRGHQTWGKSSMTRLLWKAEGGHFQTHLM